MITVRKYTTEDYTLWNTFVATAKNATFLFHRDFMEYHQDRFTDYSLLCFKGDKLMAILPINVVGNTVYSHQGLSYGGVLVNEKMRMEELMTIFSSFLFYLKKENIDYLNYKKPPFIYDELEGLQVDNILFLLNAKLERTDAYLIVPKNTYLPNRNRKRALKKANILNVEIKKGAFSAFWEKILIPNLQDRFKVKPVHSLTEILQLQSKFKNNIHCFTAHIDTEIKAGVIVFEYEDIVHFQYSSGSDMRNEDGTLEYVFDYVAKQYLHKKYISFGSSSENEGCKINKGLLYWKESFGAITIPQNFYGITTENYKLLENVLK